MVVVVVVAAEAEVGVGGGGRNGMRVMMPLPCFLSEFLVACYKKL